MAGFIFFWKITPEEYKRLTLREHGEMTRFMNKYLESGG